MPRKIAPIKVLGMDSSIQASIIDQAERQGYSFLDAEDDRLFFSLDGRDYSSARAALESLDLDDEPPDFIASSTDFRIIGTIATGWKSGSMMLLRLTEIGRNYIAMTADELRALNERLRRPPTAEEFAEMDALIDEVIHGKSTPASERAKEKYAVGCDEDLRERRNFRELLKIRPDAMRN